MAAAEAGAEVEEASTVQATETGALGIRMDPRLSSATSTGNGDEDLTCAQILSPAHGRTPSSQDPNETVASPAAFLYPHLFTIH